jgi:hypothetical protein
LELEAASGNGYAEVDGVELTLQDGLASGLEVEDQGTE